MSITVTNNTSALQLLLDKANALPDAVEQATPNISIDSSTGLITATAGTKSTTKQLTTKAATTITPGTSSKIAVAKNVYTTGAITVAGDANLTAENIKKEYMGLINYVELKHFKLTPCKVCSRATH